MSTDPTPTPTSPTSPPAAHEPVVELIRTQRQNVGYLLTALAVVFLVGSVMMVVKSNKLAAAPTDATKDGKDADDPLKALKDADGVAQSSRSDYYLGALGMALGLVVAGSGAAYLIVGLPKPTEAGQRSEARVFVLVVGGLLGVFLILMGACFFVLWNGSLVKWLDAGETKEAKYALYPVLMVVAGGLLTLLATQPARAEERNNTAVRRLVYGSNFGLTVLILFVALVIVNAVVALRLPNRLDTTGNSFYSLNTQTTQLLESLDQPIRAYAIFQDGTDPVTDDTRRLLLSAQDTNPKFRVRFLSPALNKDEISKLRAEYPLAEMSREGVLLVAGEEGATGPKRHSFIRANEFGEEKDGPNGPQQTFNGEPKLLRELLFLAENKNRPKVYFTQSSGELALNPAGRANAQRSAAALKGYLEKNYFDVQPLNFDEMPVPKVPDDASVVLVADPIRPLPPGGVEAIRKYMTEGKGKLVVLAGAQSGVDGKPLQTGLEPVLQPFGVSLSDRFLYAQPDGELEQVDGTRGIRTVQVGISVEAVKAKNPVAMGFNKLDRLPMVDCRELTSARAGGPFSSTTVLLSLPDRLTWQMPKKLPPNDAWTEFSGRLAAIRKANTREEAIKLQQAILQEYNVTDQPRELAVFVSERDKDKEVARVAVYGCGWFVSDDASTQASGRFGARGATLWLDLMGSTLDWVRDRPTVGIQEKPYSQYTLKPGFDTSRLVYVPLGIGLLIVIGLGAGVWVVRRK